MKKFIIFLFWLLLIGFLMKFIFQEFVSTNNKGGLERAAINYKEEIDLLADEFKLPSSYFMALIMLECSGRKNVPPRFEKEVFDRLVQVRAKKLSNYEHVTYKIIHDASDDAIKNLASSWGPFQLMGYKCTLLDIKIDDLRGSSSLRYGMIWIDKTYGDYLRKKRFKDAFHIHNAGKEFPKSGIPNTHDPKYIEKGLKYMRYFEKLDSLKKNKKTK